jgi:hypothetical protein
MAYDPEGASGDLIVGERVVDGTVSCRGTAKCS